MICTTLKAYRCSFLAVHVFVIILIVSSFTSFYSCKINSTIKLVIKLDPAVNPYGVHALESHFISRGRCVSF